MASDFILSYSEISKNQYNTHEIFIMDAPPGMPGMSKCPAEPP